MSQAKAATTDLKDSKNDEPPTNRILTRRASRSAANTNITKDGSVPPQSTNATTTTQSTLNNNNDNDNDTNDDDTPTDTTATSTTTFVTAPAATTTTTKASAVETIAETATDAAEVPQSSDASSSSTSTPEANPSNNNNNTPTGNNGSHQNSSTTTPTSARVTRSQSTESTVQNNNELPPEPPTTRKRSRRNAAMASLGNKKRAKSNKNSPTTRDESGATTDRETRNMSQRMTKEAREAKKAQREALIKEKLAELDQLEQTVKSGTHPEYIKLIKEIENKRAAKLKVTKASYEYHKNNFSDTFETTCKAANDHFTLQRQGFRRQMMQQVQQQISKLEQEFYSHNTSSLLDNQHVSEWTPRHRPSRLDSVVVPLTEEEANHDMALMRSAVAQQQLSPPQKEPTTITSLTNVSPTSIRRPTSPHSFNFSKHHLTATTTTNNTNTSTAKNTATATTASSTLTTITSTTPAINTINSSNLSSPTTASSSIPTQPPTSSFASKDASVSSTPRGMNSSSTTPSSLATLDMLASLADRQCQPHYSTGATSSFMVPEKPPSSPSKPLVK